MKKIISKNQSISFIILSYTLSWLCWIPIINLIDADLYSSPTFVIFLLLLGGYSPTISAIILSGITGGKKAIKELLNKFRILKVGFKWYAFALLAGPFFICIATLIYLALGGELGWVNYQVFLFLPVFFLVATVFGPLAEELGWRGFLLPKVFEKYGYLKSSIILGLVHTFWHTPLFWAAEGTSISGLPINFLTICKYALFIMGTSFVYTWVLKNARWSVFLALLVHMSFNGTGIAMNYLLPNIVDKKAIWHIEAWVLGALVLVVTFYILFFSQRNKPNLDA